MDHPLSMPMHLARFSGYSTFIVRSTRRNPTTIPLENNIMQFFANPNGLYVALMVGLWICVTAAHMPGTLVLEVIAVSALASVISMMTQYETNWLAAAMMILGTVGCLIAPLFNRRLRRVASGALAFQFVGGLLLFKSGPISTAVIAPTLAITYLLHRYVFVKALPSKD